MKLRSKIGGSMRARAPVIRHRSVDSFTTESSSGVSPQGLADDESSSTASLIRANTLGHARKYIQRSRSEERDDLTHQVRHPKPSLPQPLNYSAPYSWLLSPCAQGTVKGRLKARQQMAAAGGFGPRNNSRRSGEVGEEGPYSQTDNVLVVALAESESSVTSPSEHSALIRHSNAWSMTSCNCLMDDVSDLLWDDDHVAIFSFVLFILGLDWVRILMHHLTNTMLSFQFVMTSCASVLFFYTPPQSGCDVRIL